MTRRIPKIAPRIVVRADASTTMGLGHVKRCLALALALRELGAEVRLLTRDLGVDSAAIAKAAAIETIGLRAPTATDVVEDAVLHASWAGVTWQADAAETIAMLASWLPDWVVVDHYSFDARWHREVQRTLQVRVAAIDDLADRQLDADVVIDHNLSDDHRRKYAGRLERESALLGGPRFALLSPAYAAMTPVTVQDTVASIGIFMGGTDAHNLTSIAIEACRDVAAFDGKVEAVITRAHPHAESVRSLAARWPATQISCDLPDLAQFFARHDIQIGAGGGAAWERCRAGVPTLAVTVAANQDAVLPQLAALGAVALVEGQPSASAIGLAVTALLNDVSRRRALSENSVSLVDGRGAVRVGLRLMSSNVTVRAATLDDGRLMHEWRNHPATRSVSLNSSEIEWSDHLQWLQAALRSDRRVLLIGQVGGTTIGVVRFDRLEAGQLEVSLYLDPQLHGLGLGRSMLLAGEDWIREQEPEARFVATVLDDNVGSIRMFAAAGYEPGQGVWRKTLYARQPDEVKQL